MNWPRIRKILKMKDFLMVNYIECDDDRSLIKLSVNVADVISEM